LRRQVEDRADRVGVHQPPHRIGVDDVGVDDLAARVDPASVARGHDHLGALVQQPAGEP
jgi:hypothetical protein